MAILLVIANKETIILKSLFSFVQFYVAMFLCKTIGAALFTDCVTAYSRVFVTAEVVVHISFH